jgi:hypothetical protein
MSKEYVGLITAGRSKNFEKGILCLLGLTKKKMLCFRYTRPIINFSSDPGDLFDP